MPLYPLGISRSRDVPDVPQQAAGGRQHALEPGRRVGLRFHRRTAPGRPPDAACQCSGGHSSPHLRVAGAVRACLARRSRNPGSAVPAAA